MSPQRPGGLGRGLGELFQRTDLEAVETSQRQVPSDQQASAPMEDGSWFAEIPVADIVPNPDQPRKTFDEDALQELADSVRDVGLLQPVVVRRRGDGYELIMGERRWRAHQLAGLEKIPAIVRATDDGDMLRDALLENLHRSQLNPLEEAAAYRQLLDDFGCTKEELATRVQRSRPHISNTLRLLNLPSPVQRRVAAGVLSAGHARAILMLDDPLDQERLAQRIVAEGMSVRAAEEAVTLMVRASESGRPDRAGGSGDRRKREVPEDVRVAATTLADRLDTRVQVSVGSRKGKLTIEFADRHDLERILAILSPEDAARL
ncbi:ParB/RepB/Spo0J family partition protein [Brooklawnia cerclae]|uniref:ParB family chromosome partitioning protein n=1 Tax=Brooklawnia cerclae TaxID=349934 RepID=A0ABX0SJX8_9ACTN|nr:ParB/RepB/Spo0J family partition protein [Brooklawnia cerclae]NIH58683.1 ParB family chromosome partitioning protein [Brooklawnia cerclae]